MLVEMSFALVELGLGSAGELVLTKFVDVGGQDEDLLAEFREAFRLEYSRDWN